MATEVLFNMQNIRPYNGILPTLHPSSWVAHNATIIGDTHLGENSGIWYGCVVRGDVNEIRIGDRTNIQDLTMIHCAERGQGTYLGNDITVGHSAVLHACSVEDNAFIGKGVDIRCSIAGVAITAQMICSAGINTDKNNVLDLFRRDAFSIEILGTASRLRSLF